MSYRDSDVLYEEVVLLISSAKCKNIDVSVWLTEDGSDGTITSPDFNSKLISLGLIVGMGEDCDKKTTLDYATSDSSLGRILSLCGRGFDSYGTPLIDVSHFLKICDRMLTASINKSLTNSLLEYPLSDSAEIHVIGTFRTTSNRESISLLTGSKASSKYLYCPLVITLFTYSFVIVIFLSYFISSSYLSSHHFTPLKY
jgi:hypothetical protein